MTTMNALNYTDIAMHWQAGVAAGQQIMLVVARYLTLAVSAYSGYRLCVR